MIDERAFEAACDKNGAWHLDRPRLRHLVEAYEQARHAGESGDSGDGHKARFKSASPAPTHGQISEAVEVLARSFPVTVAAGDGNVLLVPAQTRRNFAKSTLQALIALGWGPRESAASAEVTAKTTPPAPTPDQIGEWDAHIQTYLVSKWGPKP